MAHVHIECDSCDTGVDWEGPIRHVTPFVDTLEQDGWLIGFAVTLCHECAKAIPTNSDRKKLERARA